MEEEGWSSRAGKCCGDFSPDEAGFSHASDRDAAFAGEQEVHSFFEAGIETRQDVLNRLRFDFEHAPGGVEAHFALQRRTNVASSFSLASRAGSCASRSAFGPSDKAAAGLS